MVASCPLGAPPARASRGIPGPRQSHEPSLTVGLLISGLAQISSPRVSKGPSSTQGFVRL
jgi:hypothetical protein